MYIHLLFLIFFLLSPRIGFSTEGFWLPHQVEQGIKFFGNSSFSKKSLQNQYKKVIQIGGCSGAFISPEGLVLTQYFCARSLLNMASTTQKNLLKTGFYAENRQDEIPAKKSLAIYLTIQIEDVSSIILSNLRDGEYEKNVARIKKNMTKAKQDCKADKDQECLIKEVNDGTHYIKVIRERFDDVRLVFAPSESQAYGGMDPFKLEWSKSARPFAIYRLYKNGKAYESKDYFKFSSSVNVGDAVVTIGHPDIYKRYHRFSEISSLYQYNLMAPSQIYLHRFLPLFAKLIEQPGQIRQDYLPRYQSLKRWSDSIDDIPMEYQRMPIREIKIPFEQQFKDYVAKYEPLALPWLEQYDRTIYQRHFEIWHWQSLELPMETKLMKIATRLNKMNNLNIDDFETIRRQLSKLDPEIESIDLLSAFLVVKEYPYPTYNASGLVKKILRESKARLPEILKSLFATSRLFKVGKNDRLNELKSDPIVKFAKHFDEFRKKYPTPDTSTESPVSSLVYFSLLAKYLDHIGKPFTPNIGKKFVSYSFGKVREVKHFSDTNTIFDADIDGGFRSLKGSPTLNTQLEITGMYLMMTYKDYHSVNFHYDPKRTRYLHLASSSIRNFIASRGAKKLLEEF